MAGASQEQSDATSIHSRQSSAPSIRLQNLTYGHVGREGAAINDVNVHIPAGASVAVVGRTGSGKTTLIDLIVGLLVPSGGEVWFDNTLMNQSEYEKFYDAVSYVPQSSFITDASIEENICFGRPTDETLMSVAADTVFLFRELVQKLPDGLHTSLGEKGKTLSGGQRQLVALARALYRNPKLLILDEATNALDRETEIAVIDSILKIESVTKLIITHRVEEIRNCDLIMFLKDGKVRACGAYTELLNKSNDFRQLINSESFRI